MTSFGGGSFHHMPALSEQEQQVLSKLREAGAEHMLTAVAVIREAGIDPQSPPGRVAFQSLSRLRERTDMRERLASMMAHAGVSPAAAASDGLSRLREAGIPLREKDFSDARRKALAKEGKARPDGSYPIESATDVENAVSHFGPLGVEAPRTRRTSSRTPGRSAAGPTSCLPTGRARRRRRCARISTATWTPLSMATSRSKAVR